MNNKMLTEDEQHMLDRLIRSLELQKNMEPKKRPPYYFNLEQALWLTKKLKEVNDECSKVHLELQEVNEECARLHEVYGA